MNNKEKLDYFDSNIKSIFKSDSSNLVSFIIDNIDNDEFSNLIRLWPDTLKEKIVDRYLIDNMDTD